MMNKGKHAKIKMFVLFKRKEKSGEKGGEATDDHRI